jgi:predicted RNA-binding protein with PIN domain
MLLLVDGYNVSQTGWPELAIAEQRRRLVDALTELASRTGVDVSVVFDGADAVWPAMVPATSRLVKVSFSPAEVEADDVVLARVAELDVGRPVLVASSDRRVRDGAAGMGANVLSSPQLLAALRRYATETLGD